MAMYVFVWLRISTILMKLLDEKNLLEKLPRYVINNQNSISTMRLD